MKTRLAMVLLVVGGSAAFAFQSWQRADGCAAAAGRNTYVSIADESAIIIWDDATRTEHFIRRASFSTEAKDFGFLVPTPTQPELGEASDQAFAELAKLLIEPQAKSAVKGAKGGGGQPKKNIEVLEQKRVAGQDVAVLKANDADALAKWLTDHGYDFSANLKDWVKPYIEAKWIITASKIAKDKDGLAIKNIASAAVRMSFKTEKPFFPYSEPADQRDGKTTPPPRLLRIFFIGTSRMIGAVGPKNGYWPSVIVYSRELVPEYRDLLLGHLKLPAGAAPQARFLTVFEDRSSPRPGTDDVYFRPDAVLAGPQPVRGT